jgi:hypothetical protein
MKLSDRRGAAQCRESSARTPLSGQPSCKQPSKADPQRDLLWQNLGASFAKFPASLI